MLEYELSLLCVAFFYISCLTRLFNRSEFHQYPDPSWVQS